MHVGREQFGRQVLTDELSGMEQRSFGRTGEKVSVIGLGGAALYKHSYDLGLATVALDLGRHLFRCIAGLR